MLPYELLRYTLPSSGMKMRVYGIPGCDLGWEDIMEKKGLVHSLVYTNRINYLPLSHHPAYPRLGSPRIHLRLPYPVVI
jgi:hypothetical protein